jgi:DNA-binding PadR family transcriptional regulator
MSSVKNSQNKYSIVRSSSTETILNFLYICSKTKAYGDPTIEDLISYAPNKLKRPDALEKNFQRLLSNKYIISYKKDGQIRYQITDLGKQVVFEFASDRRIKNIKDKKKAGKAGMHSRYSDE